MHNAIIRRDSCWNVQQVLAVQAWRCCHLACMNSDVLGVMTDEAISLHFGTQLCLTGSHLTAAQPNSGSTLRVSC